MADTTSVGMFTDQNETIPAPPSAAELGATGLHEFSGVIYEEGLQKLRWPNANKIWREMGDNDPVIGAILFAVEMLIRGVKWEFKPRKDSTAPDAQQKADLVNTMIDDMEKPFSEVINDVLGFLQFGFSVHEIVYKKRQGPQDDLRFNSKYNDGIWAWRKLPVRAQDTILRWDFHRNLDNTPNGLKGVVQLAPQGNKGPIEIPVEKFLLFRVNSKKDNPESRSILRNAYRPWFFKKRIEEIEAIGIERDLAGLPIAFIPPQYMSPDATPEQAAVFSAIKTIVTSVRNNEQSGIVFPMAYDEGKNKLFDFKLLGRENGSGKSFDTEKVIQRYDKRIAGIILADFILLGQQSVGSFALSSDKTDLFAAAIGAWLTSISSVFNSQALPRLWKLNGWDQASMPELTFGDIEKTPLASIADYFSKLVMSGAIVPDEKLEDWLRAAAEAPERDEESAILPTADTPENKVASNGPGPEGNSTPAAGGK